jgi:hypothetical protein
MQEKWGIYLERFKCLPEIKKPEVRASITLKEEIKYDLKIIVMNYDRRPIYI